MKLDTVIELLRTIINNRVNDDKDRSTIIIKNSDYEKAYKYIDNYDKTMLHDILVEQEKEKSKKNKGKKTDNKKPVLLLIEYNERAFAIFGDTKRCKDILLNMGGRFNPMLKHPVTNETTPGWIFSNRKMDRVKKELNL